MLFVAKLQKHLMPTISYAWVTSTQFCSGASCFHQLWGQEVGWRKQQCRQDIS